MFSVYAYKFNPTPESGFQSGDTEQLLFTVPVADSGKRPFLTASVNNELGSAGSFEFSVDTTHPYYDIWIHMRTLVRVEYDGDTVFYGRVLTIDRDMFRTRRIHCEGALTFFMDSVFEGLKNGYELTLPEYIEKLINAHNECMTNAPEKKIFRGDVPGNYSQWIDDVQKLPENDRQKYAKNQGYKDIKSWFDELVSDYGGFLRVRHDSTDGKMYLDWLKVYYSPIISNQTMSVNSNVIDLSDSVEVNNIFTHVIPVGKNNKYIDGGTAHGDGQTGKWHIYIGADPVEGGKVWATPSKADQGATITLNYTANAGYVLKKWDLLVFSGTVPSLTGNSFTMPNEDVYVSGKFDTIGGETEPDPGLNPGS